jgi:hypothetical protein
MLLGCRLPDTPLFFVLVGRLARLSNGSKINLSNFMIVDLHLVGFFDNFFIQRVALCKNISLVKVVNLLGVIGEKRNAVPFVFDVAVQFNVLPFDFAAENSG